MNPNVDNRAGTKRGEKEAETGGRGVLVFGF
jgi:hypothetical protein